jgi:hypothetical protein
MAVTLNASTSSGLVQTADTSGEIELQNNGTTKLTVNASGVNIPTLTTTTVTGTIVQGTAVASTSGTSIDFTGIPSWAKKVTVILSAVSTNGTSSLLVQIGDSGGVENTGYVSTSNSSATEVTSTAGFIIRSAVATNSTSGLMTIANLNSNIWVANFAGATATSAIFGGGTKTLSDVLTQLRITTVNGTDTFDAGSINIQYEG